MRALKNTSNTMLILANLVPLVGVLFFGWDGKSIIVIYILETVMIGIINALKMLTVYFINGTKNEPKESPKTQNITGLGIVPFFLFHYNFFIFVQSVLFFAFSSMWEPMGKGIEPFNIIGNFALYINQETAWALGSLLMANLTYFLNDFVLNDKYKKASMVGLMFAPYKRIFLQQFLVILGGFVFMLTGGIAAVMALFVVLKTIADYVSANYTKNKRVKSWVEHNIMKDKDGKPLSEEDRKSLEQFLNS
jgi:hypothetical protein